MCETNILNLFDVFTSGSKKRIEHCKYQKDYYDLTGVSYRVLEADDIELIFEATEVGKVHLTGSFGIKLDIPCDRCLISVPTYVGCEFDLFLFSEEERDKLDSEDEKDEDMSFLQGNEFDVNQFVDLSVLMNMPSKVLCKDDCKGLCPVCGQNKNETDCGCDSFVPDPRMAAIADIFNASKEV